MKTFYRLLFVFLLFSKTSFSTHIIGGDLIYKCLYYDSTLHKGYYQFTMKLYRECTESYYGCGQPQPHAEFDSLIYVTVYNANNVLVKNFVMPIQARDTIDNNTYNDSLIAPPGVCVEQATYQENFWLDDSPSGYSVTYARCCRNWDIINIILPPCPSQPDVGAAWFLTIPDTSKAKYNSSPVFNLYPPSIICWNVPFVYDHSATDPEGDSLVYELCNANTFSNNIYGTAPNPSLPSNQFYPVPYTSGYSANYPIDALPSDSFKIDSQTGLLTGTPTDTGRYVMAICVSEYRNGVLLNTNKRDFQFNVAACVEDTNLQTTSVNNKNNYPIFVSPVPSEGLLSVHYFLDRGNFIDIRVRNLPGQIIYTETTEILNYNEVKPLDLRDIPGGTYFIEFVVSNAKYRQRQLNYFMVKIILE